MSGFDIIQTGFTFTAGSCSDITEIILNPTISDPPPWWEPKPIDYRRAEKYDEERCKYALPVQTGIHGFIPSHRNYVARCVKSPPKISPTFRWQYRAHVVAAVLRAEHREIKNK